MERRTGFSGFLPPLLLCRARYSHSLRNPWDDWLAWDGQPILVRVETWNVKWIPLLNSDGILVCLDLAPTPHGYMGQIIDSDPENGTYHRWLAPNWQAFLSTFADVKANLLLTHFGNLKWTHPYGAARLKAFFSL